MSEWIALLLLRFGIWVASFLVDRWRADKWKRWQAKVEERFKVRRERRISRREHLRRTRKQ